jgi:4-amino-4-deoxy-L-arabinose transferase-like glycosyltransferase
MRFVSALFGFLTVFGVFLMTKEMFNKKVALLSSFFTAFSFWHINFSRIIFRAILVPFSLTFSFYFLFKGINNLKKNKKDFLSFAIAGIIFGLGFHTYIAFRLSVLLLAFFLIFFYVKSLHKKDFLKLSSVFLLFCFITALPIGVFFLNNFEYFMSRAGGVSVFSQESVLKAFAESFLKHLGMFNFSGDYNWRHNISGSPLLFWPVGILFLMGIFSMFFKKYRSKESIFLIAWIIIMILPGALTCEGIPHALRVIGVIPSIFIFSSLGFFFLKEKIKLKENIVIKISLIFFLVSFVFVSTSRYFLVWGKNQEVQNAFSKSYVSLGEYLNEIPPDVKKFVIVNQGGVLVDGVPVSAQTTKFIERTKYEAPRAEYILPGDIEEICSFKEKNPEEKIEVMFLNYDENLIYKLWENIPEGKIKIKEKLITFTIN